ncbi:MAG: hypothetical protein ACD_3C00169G0009 [uncultured bacterium (gcode 4)]|uniref:Uncharacterized protein n=1 Tax=uncultured bacterium (gcode 4) TaxID=1234023 RepID=K2GBY7_9BACT|nr:MAG: hypothetical protein ACD_3C00169G0009 [uncultured bacterium (gcode 4)]
MEASCNGKKFEIWNISNVDVWNLWVTLGECMLSVRKILLEGGSDSEEISFLYLERKNDK